MKPISIAKLILGTVCLMLVSIMSLAQTQQGYVKTKGRLGNNGSVIAGTRLSGATVTIKGGNAVVSGNKGTFSIAIPGNNYYLQNVEKTGYVLTDPDVLSKQYAYSKNPLILVLETPEQQADDKLAAQKKINRTLQRQLQEKEDEIELLKEQKKLSEEEYRKHLQELYKQQETNDKLINEMAERYSKIDFDKVDEFNRHISSLILEGKLTEADSLLNTKGDINSRATVLHQHQKANAQEEQELKKKQRKLEKSKAMTQKDLLELAQDCYSRFEIFKVQHQNDSAAYYILLRSELDTTNILWNREATKFLCEYARDFDNAFKLVTRNLNYIKTISKNDEDIAHFINDLGIYFFNKEDYISALKYYKEAISVFKKISDYRNISAVYNNLGGTLMYLNRLDSAEMYIMKSLDIIKVYLKNDEEKLATSYIILGNIKQCQGDFEQASLLFQKSYEIEKKLKGEIHHDVAICLYNLGGLNYVNAHFEKSIEYYKNAMKMYINIYGADHVAVTKCRSFIAKNLIKLGKYDQVKDYLSTSYLPNSHVFNTLGTIYSDIEHKWDIALTYYKTAENLFEKGNDFDNLAVVYGNLASCYWKLDSLEKSEFYVHKSIDMLSQKYGKKNIRLLTPCLVMAFNCQEKKEFDKSLYYLTTALDIARINYGEHHHDYAMCLFNLGGHFYKVGKYTESIDYYKQTSEIYKELYGINKDVAKCYMNIGDCLLKLNDIEASESQYMQALDIFMDVNENEEKNLLQKYKTDILLNLSKIGDIYTNMRKYKKSEGVYHLILENLQKLPKDFPNQHDKWIAKTCGKESFNSIFLAQFNKAEELARKGLTTDSTQHWIYTNLAPALLFQGKHTEAEQIYRQHKDELKESFLNDFHQFAEAGIIPKEWEAAVEKMKNMLTRE